MIVFYNNLKFFYWLSTRVLYVPFRGSIEFSENGIKSSIIASILKDHHLKSFLLKLIKMILKSVWLTSLVTTTSIVSGWSIEEIKNAQPMKSPKVPGRYIIEYDFSSGLNKRDDNTIESTLSSNGLDVSVNNQYDSDVFQGASIQISESNDTTVESLKAIDGIRNAWQASYITLDDTITAATEPVWNPHALTGVETLHQRGIKGKGMTIAIIDSGIDYTHPALGGGIGEGYPIIGGYDFTTSTKQPGSDPKDCIGHGTFVAS